MPLLLLAKRCSAEAGEDEKGDDGSSPPFLLSQRWPSASAAAGRDLCARAVRPHRSSQPAPLSAAKVWRRERGRGEREREREGGGREGEFFPSPHESFFSSGPPPRPRRRRGEKKKKKRRPLTVQKLKPLGVVPRPPRPDLLRPPVQIPAALREPLLERDHGVVRPQPREAELEQRDARGVAVEAVRPLKPPEDGGEDGREEGRRRLRGQAGHDVLLRGREPVSQFFFFLLW